MRFGIGSQPYEIKREDILTSTKGVRPKTFDGRNKYYVELHGEKYPIKQAIHLATGLRYTEDFTAQYAKRILIKLGFSVRRLEDDRVREKVKKSDTYTTDRGNVCKFAVTLDQDEDGYIVISCPALPGCHSQGRTEEEALKNIREAISGYIASMRRHGETIPSIKEIKEVEVVA
jgi:antitoxin HicB